MPEADIQRLQNDVETIRSVLGADLPYQRIDVLGLFCMGVAALLPVAVCVAGLHSPAFLLASTVPYLIVLVVYLLRNFWGAHPSRPCPAAKRREYRIGLPIMLLSVPLIIGFRWWALAAGATGAMTDASVLLFIGLVLAYQGLYDPGRRSVLFVGLPCIVVAFAWPFVASITLWTILWLSIAFGMMSAAGYLRWQLTSSSKTAGA